MPYFQGEFGENYYTQAGLGNAIVFLHGLGGSHKTWFRQVPFFKKSFRTLLPDHAGCGQSALPQEELSIEGMAADVGHLLDHLKIEKAVFIGSSMGGVVAQSFAARFPERMTALVLASTFVSADPYIHQVLMPLLRKSTSPQVRVKAILPLLFSSRFLETEPQVLKKYVADAENLAPRRDILQNQVRALLNYHPAPLQSHLKAPVLVLAGSEDTITPPRMADAIVTHYPHAQRHVVAGAKHLLHIEKAEEFNRAVKQFLEF